VYCPQAALLVCCPAEATFDVVKVAADTHMAQHTVLPMQKKKKALTLKSAWREAVG
jgi:hypothetical protein